MLQEVKDSGSMTDGTDVQWGLESMNELQRFSCISDFLQILWKPVWLFGNLAAHASRKGKMRTYNLFDVSIYTDYVCVTGSQLGLLGHLGQGTVARRGT